MRRRWVGALVGLGMLTALVGPESRATGELNGYASAYAPGVMEDVVAYRLENRLWRHIPPSR